MDEEEGNNTEVQKTTQLERRTKRLRKGKLEKSVSGTEIKR